MASSSSSSESNVISVTSITTKSMTPFVEIETYNNNSKSKSTCESPPSSSQEVWVC